MLNKSCWVAAVVVVAGLTVGCDSSANPAPTTVEVGPPTTTAASTVPSITVAPTTVAPPTTEVPPTTAAPPTTVAPAPPTTSIEDQLLEAITRAQTALRNCYASFPGPCDPQELENALVGAQLETVLAESQEAAETGYHAEGLDRLQWSILDGPTLKGDELAVATICRRDGAKAVLADGSVLDDEEVVYVQTWHLLPVGNTWKLGETINETKMLASEGDPCE